MQIYPAIEIQNRRIVTLNRGRLDEPEVWHLDPLARARAYAEAGAGWIHVTDLDGVADAGGTNNGLLLELIRGSGASIQLAGGFRSFETIARWIDFGAARIVLGTLAVTSPAIVKRAAKYFPDQIVLAVDFFEDRVMTHGWRTSSAFAPDEFLESYAEDPLAAIVLTDIAGDIGDAGASLAHVAKLAESARVPVIARGLVHTLDDLSRIKYVPGIDGAMVGRALLEKTLDLGEALALAAEIPAKRAEFI